MENSFYVMVMWCKIKQPLAHEILFGKLVDGGSVIVSEKDGELELNF